LPFISLMEVQPENRSNFYGSPYIYYAPDA
jgi:hypothetical protein